MNILLVFLINTLLMLGIAGCASDGQRPPETQVIAAQTSSADPSPTKKDSPFPDPGVELEEDEFDPFEEQDEEPIEEYDPWESFNVWSFEFNYRLDKYVLKPVATAYDFVIPTDVQQSIGNVFQNVRFAPRFFNNIFQGKFKGASIELGRFLINSTLGVGGLFDPAKAMFDLETPPEDTGQTLGVYGASPGPYLVIPFLGPFTLRDGIGYIGDAFLDPFNWLVLPIIEIGGAPIVVGDNTTRTIAQSGKNVGETVNTRSLNLEKFQGVEEGTLDLYGAVRNGYLQQRAKAIEE